MGSPRVMKLADQIKVIVAEMLERRIKDPRLGFVTVTDVRLTGDTHHTAAPLNDKVVTRQVFIWSVLPVARDRTIYQPWV